MAREIFISYSAKDGTVANAVCKALEKESLSCWIAPRDITPGKKYAEAIIDGINDCRIFLLILSTTSNDSPQVEMEVDRAASKDIPILSFRIDQVVLSKTMEYYLSSRHWLDASIPPLEDHVSLLVQTIKHLLHPVDPGEADQVSSPDMEKQQTPVIIPKINSIPSVELPKSIVPHNPFTFGNPISEPERFFCRKQEIRQILNRLMSSAHESTSIVGERRIGKTSLLNYLSNPECADSLGLAHDKYCLIYVDFQGLTDITPQRFWQRILGKMAHSICHPELIPAIKEITGRSKIDLFDLEDIFDSIHDKGMVVVLFMDEFEYVTQNPNFKGDFFGSLRALAIHHGVALIPATRRQLVDLCYSNELKGSPFFNIFANLVLKPFSRHEIDELINGYSKLGQMEITPEENDLIWSLAGGFPFFAQMAGYYLLEGKIQGLTGRPLEDSLLQNFSQQSGGHYSHLWSTSTESEKTILIAVLMLGSIPGLKKLPVSLEHLVKIRSRASVDAPVLARRGLLEENQGFSLFSQGFGTWIHQELIATSEEDVTAGVMEPGKASSEGFNLIQSTLHHYKKKYWSALSEIASGLSKEMDPVLLLESFN
jgi:hypothetical protein